METSTGTSTSSSSGVKRFKAPISLQSVKVFPYRDSKAPPFPEKSFGIAKHTIFFREEIKTKVIHFAVIELHVVMADAALVVNTHPFRVFTHSGLLLKDSGNQIKDSVKECRFLASVWDAEDIYAQLFQNYEKKGSRKVSRNPSYLIGSDFFVEETKNMAGPEIDDEIKNLIEEIFAEANAELAEAINEDVGIPTVTQIEEGEGLFH